MYHANYLIHYNGNHSSKNGQFTSGDGDKDGITDDHHHYSKNKKDLADPTGHGDDHVSSKQKASSRPRQQNQQPMFDEETKQQMKTVTNNKFVLNIAASIVCTAARKALGFAFSKTKLGKTLKEIHAKEVGEEFVKVTQLDKIAKEAGITDAKKQLDAKVKGKIAEGIQKGANQAIDQDFRPTNSQAKKLKVGLGVAAGIAGTAAVAGGAYAAYRGVKAHNKATRQDRANKRMTNLANKLLPSAKSNEPYTSEAGKKLLSEYHDIFDNKKKRSVLRHGTCGDYIITLPRNEEDMSYLIHFNKNHSPKNGQFTSGDGDADGVKDDHHNYSKNKVTVKTEVKTGK